MESVIHSPTPTPTKSLSTFTLDTLSNSIEYPRYAPASDNVSNKNQFLNGLADKLSNNIESHKTRFSSRRTINDNDIMDITNTSNILTFDESENKNHKNLTSLPDNPVNKLLHNAVNMSAGQLTSLKNENKALKKRVEQLQKANTQLASSNRNKDNATAEALMSVNEALVKKVQKYKTLSQNQNQIILKLQEKIKQLNVCEPKHETPVSDDTNILLSNHSIDNDEILQTSTSNKRDDNVDRLHAEINQFMEQMSKIIINTTNKQNESTKTSGEYYQQQQQQQQQQQINTNKNEDNDQLAKIKEEVEQIKRQLLEKLSASSPQPNEPEREPLPAKSHFNQYNSIDCSVESDPVQKSKKAQTINIQADKDILMIENVLQKYIKRKQLEKELKELQSDEYLQYVDQISRPIVADHEKPKAKSYQKPNFERHNHFSTFTQPQHKRNIDLQTLRSFKHNGNINDTWSEGPTSDNVGLDELLSSLKEEYQELVSQYQTLSSETLSNEPDEDFKANKRSMDVLNGLLGKIDKKRQEIYKLSQIIGQNEKDEDGDETELIW